MAIGLWWLGSILAMLSVVTVAIQFEQVSKFISEQLASLNHPPTTSPLSQQASVEAMSSVEAKVEAQFRELEEKVERVWGKENTKLPSETEVVKYSQDLQSRSIIDLKDGMLIVETREADDSQTLLKDAMVAALLTPDDPRLVDVLSTKPNLIGNRKPFLLGQIVDQKGKWIDNAKKAEQFTLWVLGNRQEVLETETGKVHRISVPLDANHHKVRSDRFVALFDQAAKSHHVDPSLLYAIAETESRFNPFAISRGGAIGLMQLIPSTAGLDAMRATGKDRKPTKEELFDPLTNVTLGAVYCNLLEKKYLSRIKDASSREYLAIASYTLGVTKALKIFSDNRTDALKNINGLSSQMVYDTIRNHQQAPELRGYVHKVTNAKRKFASSSASST